jgi:hypothetical protein
MSLCCFRSREHSPAGDKNTKLSKENLVQQNYHTGPSSKTGAENLSLSQTSISGANGSAANKQNTGKSIQYNNNNPSNTVVNPTQILLQEQLGDLEIDPEMAANLETVVSRLEAVASRLEQVAVSGGGAGSGGSARPAVSGELCPCVIMYKTNVH